MVFRIRRRSSLTAEGVLSSSSHGKSYLLPLASDDDLPTDATGESCSSPPTKIIPPSSPTKSCLLPLALDDDDPLSSTSHGKSYLMPLASDDDLPTDATGESCSSPPSKITSPSSPMKSFFMSLASDDGPPAAASARDESWLAPTMGKLGKGGKMIKSTSMLEMKDIHDMLDFSDAMDALAVGEPTTAAGGAADKSHPSNINNAAATTSQDDDEDDGFFFGDDEEEEQADNGGGFLQQQLSSSPDTVIDVPQVTPSRGGGMRRVMSMASMTSAPKKRFSLLRLGSDIEPISEEGNHDPPKALKPSTQSNNFSPSGNNDVPLRSSKGSSTHLDHNVDVTSSKNKAEGSENPQGADSTLDLSTNSRNRRSRCNSNVGMPRRSCMKGSSNTLRSSLRSNSSLDDSENKRNIDISNHSIGDNSKSSMKRNISFASVEIRSYDVTLGDAPTTAGPAISLDWNYDPEATTTHELEHYEQFRTDEAPRRAKHEMRMPPMHRQYLLMREAGFTKGEIQMAMEDAKRVARQREKTKKMSRLGFVQPVEEVLEKTSRKMTKMGILGKKGGGKK